MLVLIMPKFTEAQNIIKDPQLINTVTPTPGDVKKANSFYDGIKTYKLRAEQNSMRGSIKNIRDDHEKKVLKENSTKPKI